MKFFSTILKFLWRLFLLALFAFYIWNVMSYTFLPIQWQPMDHMQMDPFAFLKNRAIYDNYQIIGNLVLLIPLPIFMGLLHKRFRSLKAAFFTSLLISLGIEFAQYWLYVWQIDSRVTDASDVLLNTVGGMLGYLIFAILFLPLLPRNYDKK